MKDILDKLSPRGDNNLDDLDEHLLMVEEMANGDLFVKIPPKLYDRMQQHLIDYDIDGTVEGWFKKSLLDLIAHNKNQTTLI
jgi:hypothetical protein